ncbi:MAG: DUF4837 family protein [Flavobacteriales bacterium]
MNKLAVFLILLLSCGGQSTLPPFTGAVNEVVVVMEDNLWEGSSGDSLRRSLQEEVKGIAWSETLFDVVHITSKSFSRLFQTHRNVIIVQKGSQSKVVFNPQRFSEDQWLCVFEYRTETELRQLINQYAPVVSKQILEQEKKRFLNKRRGVNNTILSEKFDLILKTPSKYNLVLDTTNFVWLSYNPKDLELIEGILCYSFDVEDEFFNVNTLLTIRDSLLNTYIRGQIDGSYMATEYLYSPVVKSVDIDNLSGYNVKGLWKMENAFMGGPFTTYFMRDSVSTSVIAIDGFLFNPGEEKRNVLQELDWTISSFKTEP